MKKYYRYLFVSRNKDNKHIENFKEKRIVFLSDLSDFEVKDKIDKFKNSLAPNTVYRIYRTFNSRSLEKTQKSLIHYLIDHPMRY